MAFKDQVWDMLKEIGGSFMGDFLSMGFLKKILTGAVRSKITGEGKEKEEKSDGDRIPEVKFGGYFNMSDEVAYMGVIALMESDPNSKDVAASVSKYVASLESWQQRNFRVAIGTLAQIDYLKKVVDIQPKKIDKKLKNGNIETTTSGGKKEEEKINLGVQFLRSFVRLDDGQKREVCESAGILEPSVGQKLKKYALENEDDCLKKIEHVKSKIPPKEEIYGGFVKEMFGVFRKKR